MPGGVKPNGGQGGAALLLDEPPVGLARRRRNLRLLSGIALLSLLFLPPRRADGREGAGRSGSSRVLAPPA